MQRTGYPNCRYARVATATSTAVGAAASRRLVAVPTLRQRSQRHDRLARYYRQLGPRTPGRSLSSADVGTDRVCHSAKDGDGDRITVCDSRSGTLLFLFKIVFSITVAQADNSLHSKKFPEQHHNPYQFTLRPGPPPPLSALQRPLPRQHCRRTRRLRHHHHPTEM